MTAPRQPRKVIHNETKKAVPHEVKIVPSKHLFFKATPKSVHYHYQEYSLKDVLEEFKTKISTDENLNAIVSYYNNCTNACIGYLESKTKKTSLDMIVITKFRELQETVNEKIKNDKDRVGYLQSFDSEFFKTGKVQTPIDVYMKQVFEHIKTLPGPLQRSQGFKFVKNRY